MKSILLVLLTLIPLLAWAADFSGTYTSRLEDTEYRLTIQQAQDGAATGTLKEGTDTFKLQGKLQGAVMTGTLIGDDGEKLQFKIERRGDNLLFTLFDTDEGEIEELGTLTFIATAGGAAKTEAVTKTETPVKETGEVAAPAKNLGKQHKLLWGSSFSVPANWSIADVRGETYLVPTEPGQLERYLVPVVGVAGGAKADTEEFLQALQSYLAQAAQGMQIVENKVVKTPSGPGRVLAYEGTGPQGLMRLQIYVTVQGDLGTGILAIGTAKEVNARISDLDKIFATFTPGQGQLSEALVGPWVSKDADYTKPDSRGYGRSTRSRTVQLGPDGRFVMENSSRTVISGDGFHADSGPSVSVSRGRWFASNNVLIIVGEGGDMEYFTYTLSHDGALRLTDRQGKSELYSRR